MNLFSGDYEFETVSIPLSGIINNMNNTNQNTIHRS